MQQEYTYSRGFRIVFICLGTFFALMPLLAIFSLIVNGWPEAMVDIVTGLISIALPVAVVIYCISQFLSVVYTDNDGIRYQSFLRTRALLWQEVKGYRKTPAGLVIVSGVKGKGNVRVSAQRRNYKEIAEWVTKRYPDLTIVVAQIEVVAEYETTDELKHKLKKARYAAITLNSIAFVAAVLSIFFYDFMTWLPLVLMAIIPAILVALEYHKGLIVIVGGKEESCPSFTWALLFCAAGLFKVAVPIYNLMLPAIWKGAFVITALFTLLLFFCIRHWKGTIGKKIFGVFVYVFFITVISFESIVFVNTFFDNSTPQLFETTIVDKRISKRRSTSYFLVVRQWGPVESPVSISVGKRKYEAIAINDVVKMALYRGALEMPWYTPLVLKD